MPIGGKSTPAAKPAAAPKPSAPDDKELRDAQLAYYRAGAAYYTKAVDGLGKAAAPGASPPKPPSSSPAATPSSGGKTAPASPAPQASSSAKAPAAQPAAPAAASAPSSGGELATKTRKELVEIARGLGIDTPGLKAEDLRSAIESAGGAPAAQSGSGGEPAHIIKAKALMKAIDDDYEKYEAAIDPNGDQLKCGGDCVRCPHPEAETAEAQIESCYESIVGG